MKPEKHINVSICIACGAYETRSCEWDGDDPPCEHEDMFERDAEPEIDPDYLRELRDERANLAKTAE